MPGMNSHWICPKEKSCFTTHTHICKPAQPPAFPVPFTQLLRPNKWKALVAYLFPRHLRLMQDRPVSSVFRIYPDCFSSPPSPPSSPPSKPKPPSSPAWSLGLLPATLASHRDRTAQRPKWSFKKHKKQRWLSYSKPSNSLSLLSEPSLTLAYGARPRVLISSTPCRDDCPPHCPIRVSPHTCPCVRVFPFVSQFSLPQHI